MLAGENLRFVTTHTRLPRRIRPARRATTIRKVQTRI